MSDLVYSSAGPVGVVVANREESRVPSVEEPDAGGNRHRALEDRRRPVRCGCCSHSIVVARIRGSSAERLPCSPSASVVWVSAVWPMAASARVRTRVVSRLWLCLMQLLMSCIVTRPPKRDWRDWFIMATVMGGVGYGLYSVAKVWTAWLSLLIRGYG